MLASQPACLKDQDTVCQAGPTLLLSATQQTQNKSFILRLPDAGISQANKKACRQMLLNSLSSSQHWLLAAEELFCDCHCAKCPLAMPSVLSTSSHFKARVVKRGRHQRREKPACQPGPVLPNVFNDKTLKGDDWRPLEQKVTDISSFTSSVASLVRRPRRRSRWRSGDFYHDVTCHSSGDQEGHQ